MPIHHSHATSITDVASRSLELFCDRIEARATFARYANALRPIERILFFHGDGGNGKSLLLRKLKADYCRQLPDADRWPDLLDEARWSRLPADSKRRELESFDAALKATGAWPLDSAFLDFGGPARSLEDLRDPVSAMGELRRQLGVRGFKFPLFDYAMVLCLHKNGRLTKGKLQEIFGSIRLDVITQIAETLSELPLISVVPKLLNLATKLSFGKDLDTEFTKWTARRNLDDGVAQRLACMDGASELPLELPRLLAEDLNLFQREDKTPHRRVVLFFDTHEAFWGQVGRSEGRARSVSMTLQHLAS